MIRETAGITYTYTAKKVKNINLRVGRDGLVSVSAPTKMSLSAIDTFVQEKASWIKTAQIKQQQRDIKAEHFSSEISAEECLPLFKEILEKWAVQVTYAPPQINLAVKDMKSRWGVCYPSKGKIVLNKKLVAFPYALQEYVIVHELVHFKYPNHQKGFHDEMQRLMPDYKQRRKALRSSV